MLNIHGSTITCLHNIWLIEPDTMHGPYMSKHAYLTCNYMIPTYATVATMICIICGTVVPYMAHMCYYILIIIMPCMCHL